MLFRKQKSDFKNGGDFIFFILFFYLYISLIRHKYSINLKIKKNYSIDLQSYIMIINFYSIFH